jgi:hypothetical protein
VNGEPVRDEVVLNDPLENLIAESAPKKRKNNSQKYVGLDKVAVVDYALEHGQERALQHYKAYEIPQQTLSDWITRKRDGVPLHGMV